MKHTSTYRTIFSGILALLVLNAVVLKEVHHLLDHHHDEVLHCESHETHLHSEAYAPVDCFICYFHFSPVDDYFEAWVVDEIATPGIHGTFNYDQPVSFTTYRIAYPRGPPSLS